jgi:23S rRNA pseudouridine1911/1915/1917 synthase
MAKRDILVLHTTHGEAGRTLVSALRSWLPDQSWNQLRRLIESRRVQIDGNLCLDAGRKLNAGEVVRVLPHAQAPPPRQDDVRIHYVDSAVVVVEKPAGMTTLRHSEELGWPERRKDRQPTLDELLPRLLRKPSVTSHRGKPPRVRAVHRLDRDTSGLLVFARTVEAERHLVQQFRQHTIHRRYLAVIHGTLSAQTITSRLVRDRGDGRRGSTTNPRLGQHAVTHVRPVEEIGEYSLVECRLETGRTHQIRIHLSELGHFVCGDRVYCQPLHKKPLSDTSGAPRLALHAAELGFEHPLTGESLRFKMPLPPDLHDFLNRLRSANRTPRTEG